MSAGRRNRLRLAGIVALVCAGAVFAADVTMLGLPVSGAEAAAVDYRNLLRLPEWRLRVGGYGAFLIFGFLAGTWQLYEGIKPAGAWWSLPPFLFISYFFASGAVFHYLLAFAIAAGKTQAEAQGAGGQVTAALVQTARAYLLVPYYVSSGLTGHRLNLVRRDRPAPPDALPALDGAPQSCYSHRRGLCDYDVAARPGRRLPRPAGSSSGDADHFRRDHGAALERGARLFERGVE